ncbi:MAG: PAS domain-containing protein [Oceanibaculum nanhaiense]|uniref:PAS domain-containing protein n=1 Tax=Oceanibaculum nanhaiense TaxID=1909734 RepID=UPI0025A48A94|nr:PAS domain-containing protein [Oceanibaculum nanhaiense]MDM7945058.1 PAS domain-containing protein [Oceanibaculum nanhaiense]
MLSIQHEELAALHRFWLALSKDGRLPARHDFLAEHLAPWIGHISLLEVERDPLRFRFLVHGGHFTLLTGSNLTGRYLEDGLSTRYRDIVLDSYREVVETRQVVHQHYTDDTQPWRELDRLLLPLADDGVTVDRVMVGLYTLVDPPSKGGSRLLSSRN